MDNKKPKIGILPYLLEKNKTEPVPEPEQLQHETNPMVKEYLATKYGLSPELSANAYKDAQERVDSRTSDLGWAQFAAGMGDALAGRNPSQSAQAFEGIRSNIKDQEIGALDRRRKAQFDDFNMSNSMEKSLREREVYDPKSSSSQSFRKMMEAKFPEVAQAYGDDWANVTAADQDNIFKPLQLKETVEARKMQAAAMAGQRRDALDLKATEKSDKKKAAMFEIEDRRTNINESLNTLKKMIDEDGTYELLGSHNQDMDRLIEGIATDMAKLQDPNSVARPSEVESVKKNLIQSGIFTNKNSTASQVLKNFEAEVAKRADSAYKVRGIDIPNAIPVSKDAPPVSDEDAAAESRRKRIAELKAKQGNK